MRQEMEAMKLIMEQQVQTIQELRVSKAAPQLRLVALVMEAGQEMETNEAKLDWARAMARAMAGWAAENLSSILESEYEAGMKALSEEWSHVQLEVEKEEVKAQVDGAQETKGAKKATSKEEGLKAKPKTEKVAPQHVQDRRQEHVKERFTNMGTSEEMYESKGGKFLKTGKPPRYPCNSCRVKHWWSRCPVESD